MTFVKLNQKTTGRAVDHLFDEFLNSFPVRQGNGLKNNVFGFPPANIYESKDAYHVEINVPGRNKEDFNIQIGEGLLTVSFEKKAGNKPEDYKTIRREFEYLNFNRSFSLDETINTDNIQATYENGILKLSFPKKEEVKPVVKQINIQ